jgi:hypothetical protein
MIANMNHEEFICELKNMVCHSDKHKRYYTKRSRKFNRWDYWLKGSLGTIAGIGALMAATDHWRVAGACVAGACSFALGSFLPNFKWEPIVSGINEEREEWTRIFQGYEGLLRMSQILERDEMLSQEYQKVEEMRKASALNDRKLPEDEVLLEEIDLEVRQYWRIKWGEEVVLPTENKGEK